MTRKVWQLLKIGSLFLLIVFSLSACNLPASNPTAEPTASVAPSQTPAPANPTSTVEPSPTAQVVPDVSLRTFQMVDGQHGWAASENLVLRTEDGGKTWENATPGDVPAGTDPSFQVIAVTAQAAWMIVPDAGNFRQGTLYRTADGGQTWQSAAVPFGSGWVQFQDDKVHAVLMADRGVAAGSQGVDLYQTEDSGATWNLISHVDPENPSDQGIPFGGNKSGVTFLDPSHGWVTGFIPMDGAVYLYATQDGGMTWQQVPLELPGVWQQAQIEAKPPVFFGGQEGILPLRASVNGGQLVLFVTHDGGATWQATTTLQANGMVSIPSAADVIVWDGAVLHYSLDAGQTWQERTPDVDLSQGLIALQFVDRNTGWALSQEAGGTRLYRTTDGGVTWE